MTKIKSKGLLNENLPIGKYWMTHPWTLEVGYKFRMRELLNNDFINYEGPMHITSKNLVDDKNT